MHNQNLNETTNINQYIALTGNNNICAIVVTYNPDIKILNDLIISTLSMVGHLVVVDNSLGSDVLIWYQEQKDRKKITLLPMKTNIGLAAGLNQGIVWARQQGYSYVLLLDQDTVPDSGMVKHLLEAIKFIESQGVRVAAVGPCHFDPRTGYRSSFKSKQLEFINPSAGNKRYSQINYLQSSGSLISTQVFDMVGLMNETLFIHHVDYEWCFRAKNKGFVCFGISDVFMTHRVGEKVIRLWLGYWRDIHIHSPFRQYFLIRNSILLYKLDYIDINWKILDALRLFIYFLFYSLLITPRYANFKMAIKGFIDGINYNRINSFE